MCFATNVLSSPYLTPSYDYLLYHKCCHSHQYEYCIIFSLLLLLLLHHSYYYVYYYNHIFYIIVSIHIFIITDSSKSLINNHKQYDCHTIITQSLSY